jgi:phosphoribosylaminoimidazole-succinocarboxamide synthase
LNDSSLDFEKGHADNAGCHHEARSHQDSSTDNLTLVSCREGTIKVVTQTSLPGVELFRRGKVRDVYSVEDKLLIVATDRVSAFDVVMPNGIPHKGVVLTALTLFWFNFLSDIVPNHLITADVDRYPAQLAGQREVLAGRSMLVSRAEVFPIECVARGYLAGSGWKEYQATGEVCGLKLPAGLTESDRLPDPIFTPATKAESGHDLNISESEAANLIGEEATRTVRDLTLSLYSRAAEYALSRGIIIADTKFEFGVKDGQVILVDEALTPDSSRFWPRDSYQPGRSQQSFDKQYLRDYLETLSWNKQPPGPELPDNVVARTSEKYLEALRSLTGETSVAESIRSQESGFKAQVVES